MEDKATNREKRVEKTSIEMRSIDHDLLIELKTRMEAIRDDIKDLKDGTTVKIADHENRIFSLETSKTKQQTLTSIAIGLLSVLTAMLIYHMFGIKI